MSDLDYAKEGHNFGVTDVEEKTGHGYLHLGITDERYPYTPETRQAAIECFRQDAQAWQLTLNEVAGKELDAHSLARQLVNHEEDQDTNQKVKREREWEAVLSAGEPVDERSQSQKALDNYVIEQQKLEDGPKLTMLKERVEKEKADKARADKLAALDTPKRREAVKKAKAQLAILRFDPRAPASEVREAEYRLRLAKTGDLTTYAQEMQAFITRYASYLEKRAIPTIAEAQRALKQSKKLTEIFEPYDRLFQ